MKNRLKISLLSFAVTLFSPYFLSAQEGPAADSTGRLGDHLSLEAVLDIFKKATSPEDFEKLLNSETNAVNNLDLNEDGEVDYIRVVDNMEGDMHAIVLQIPISTDESQDIAVIEIEKKGPEEAILQIVGDSEIFGEQRIVEPFKEEGEQKGRGPWQNMSFYRVVVNVYFWPCVSFIYRPTYSVYVSPFYWAHYPTWWRPWRPYPWRVYHTRHIHYRSSYHVVTTHRVVRAHAVYTPRRKTSTVVHTRNTRVTTVSGPKGQVKAARTTTTTTVGGARGNVKTSSSTTTVAGAKGNNGKVVGAKKTTTTNARVNNRNGTAVRKTTTTKAAAAKGNNGRVATGKRTTTTVRRKKN